jgi:hypothetical protein
VTYKAKADEAFKDLLAKIPSTAVTVQVKDGITGKIRYKPVKEIRRIDEIQVNKEGIPVTTRKLLGRPKNIIIEPKSRVTAELIKQKKEALGNDPILQVARTNPEDPDLLQQIVLALGTEAASIGFERQQAELNGEKTSELSVRRINALKAIGDTWLKRREQVGTRGIDMNSPAYRVLMTEILTAFQESLASEGVRPESIQNIFTKMDRIMNAEWEANVKTRMKHVI